MKLLDTVATFNSVHGLELAGVRTLRTLIALERTCLLFGFSLCKQLQKRPLGRIDNSTNDSTARRDQWSCH
jgi:hypothetical protein